MIHDDAIEKVEKLGQQRHRESRDKQWMFREIEDMDFFTDDEIWELLDAFG